MITIKFTNQDGADLGKVDGFIERDMHSFWFVCSIMAELARAFAKDRVVNPADYAEKSENNN